MHKHPLIRLTGEMRKGARKVFFTPIYYKFDQSTWTLSQALNISSNGACMVVNHLVNVGDKVHLEMPHKNMAVSEVLLVHAEVIWVRESIHHAHQYECGVAFKEKQVKYRREKNRIFEPADLNCVLLERYVKDCVGKTVSTLDELKEAYEVLYNEYSVKNLCMQNEARLYYNFYNLIPEARTFVLKRGDDLLGTISVILDSPCGLPMEATYPQEIKKFRQQGMRLGEIGCLALNSKFFDKSRHPLKDVKKQAHLFKLYKTMYDYVRHMTDCTDLVMGCHPRHAALYKYLCYEEAGEARRHKAVGGAPAVLMKFDIENVVRNNTLLNEGPGMYFLKKTDSMHLLKEHFPWTAQTVKSFLHHFRPIWGQLSKEQRQYINKVYPTI